MGRVYDGMYENERSYTSLVKYIKRNWLWQGATFEQVFIEFKNDPEMVKAIYKVYPKKIHQWKVGTKRRA